MSKTLIEIVRLTDQHKTIADLYGVEPDDLRWLATDRGQVLGTVTAWLRPDDRMFLKFTSEDPRVLAPLAERASLDLGRPVSCIVDKSSGETLRSLRAVGFVTEVEGERFRLPFNEIMRPLERAWVPTGYRIVSVADVDEAAAFELDNRIRSLVPGSDGWQGDREWFSEELASPEFSADAYLVAMDVATEQLVGLLRIWRNPDGPRLGLIGLLPDHRRPSLAAALLKQGLGAAATWGSETFVTETSPSNENTYPRMIKLNCERLGGFVQLLRK